MEITADTILGYGLMNKISTGHPWLDMLLCLLVPLLMRSLVPWVSDHVSEWWTTKTKPTAKYTRIIEFTTRNSYSWWYDSDTQPSNVILQRALLTLINRRTEVINGLPSADLQLKKRVVEHTVLTGDDAEEEVHQQSTEHAYDVNCAPPVGEWVDLGNNIRFMRQMENADEKGKTQKTTYFLESHEVDGNTKIEAFVQEALDLYKKQQSQKIDLSRYLYIPVLTGFAARVSGEEGANKPNAIYKRYKLSEEKTFKSFFHPDKEGILSLVDNFVNKTGKFGIAGYPQKLGFLLYGPPGTGKTSFIKALGQYTRRSIISIPLTKIHTNQELMDVVMDQKIQVENEEGSISLPYGKTIFVMEDVDAASSVVHRRTEGAAAAELADIASAMKLQAARQKASKSKAQQAGGEISEASSDDDDDVKRKSKKASSGTKASFGPMPMFGRSMFGDDALNLAGLLNVLDGVVDTPNRIVIMTTNHPEKLDPALIRPGRINKRVFMGRICVGQALQMMGHYFGQVPAHVERRLREVFVDEALSPADLEAMCADYDTPEEMVEHVAERFGRGGEAAVAAAAAACATPAVTMAGGKCCAGDAADSCPAASGACSDVASSSCCSSGATTPVVPVF